MLLDVSRCFGARSCEDPRMIATIGGPRGTLVSGDIWLAVDDPPLYGESGFALRSTNFTVLKRVPPASAWFSSGEVSSLQWMKFPIWKGQSY
ncbi:hypothetical protein QR680_005401 [Steinernema hermaphroditum]|uniref:Uncharacterized protein n=1 Tax=Steinernema hermaphroditum TaxID=289476 RepID=A0AA39HSX8_9BILA|nr:hypothetical protein QR680_005401 [Steinernema hermaphroditum]